MAKNSDQLAGNFDHENTGGVLTGLLADEENFDRRAMLRLGTWGVASVAAVIIAVLANQSAIKTRRDEVASLDLTRQSMQIQSVAKESQNESRRLASAIDTLNGDRDRLYSRLTSVEQGLESVTGAIAKQTAAAPAPPPAVPPVASSQTSPPQPVAQSAPQEPAPIVAPVATVAAALPATEKIRGDSRKPPSTAAIVAALAPAPSAAPAPSLAASPAPSSLPAATSSMPAMTSRSLMAPPDPAAPKLIEPEQPAKPVAVMPAPTPSPAAEVVATPAPASVSAAAHEAAGVPAADKAKLDAAAIAVAVKRTEFGVDVGGANSVGGLRALWRGLLKSRANAPLAALQPIIVVKESNSGLGMQLRLVAGPLSDAAAAAKICAAIADNERSCETTVYDGQHLAMKADDAPVSTESISAKPDSGKPASEGSSEKPAPAKPGSNKYFHHRGSYTPSSSKHAAAEEQPAKKPETGGTLSSFFSSRLRPQ